MKLSVNSEETTAFRVSIQMTDKEKTDIQDGIVTFSLCIARLIGEFIQSACENTQEAKALADIISSMSEDMLEEYVNTVFEDVHAIREEAKMYGYMEDMFAAFLEGIGSDREAFLQKYKDSKTLTVEPALNGKYVSVVFSNGVVGDVMEDFPITLIEADPETFHRTMSIAYLAGIVAGDLIFGEHDNPIRNLDTGPECDGGLSEKVKMLLS